MNTLVLPPQILSNKWQMNMIATQNTMEYIFNVIRHPCYLIGIKHHQIFFFKITPKNKNQTPEIVYDTIKTNLQHLNQNPYLDNIDKKYIRSSIDLNNIRLMQCILKDYSETGLDLSQNEYFLLINNIKERLNNGLFILNLNDTTILKEKKDTLPNPFPFEFGKINEPIPTKYKHHITSILDKPFLPILGAGKQGFLDIPIPNYDEVIRILNNNFIDFKNTYTPWNSKINKAVFRGSPSGCGTNDKTNMRIKLSKLSKTTSLSKYVDSCLVGKGDRAIKMDPIYGLSKNYNKDMMTASCFNKGMPMIQQSGYKYIIHIDGNVNAYRLLNTMLTGSLILRVKSNYIHWADYMLKEGENYLSISQNLNDTEKVIKWCINHDSICKNIAKKTITKAERLISAPFIYNLFIIYFNYLSEKLTTISPNSPIIPSNEILWSNAKRCPNNYRKIEIKNNKKSLSIFKEKENQTQSLTLKTKLCKKKTSKTKRNISLSGGENKKTLKLVNRDYAVDLLPKGFINELYKKYNSSKKITLEEMQTLNFTRINDKWLAIYISSFFLD